MATAHRAQGKDLRTALKPHTQFSLHTQLIPAWSSRWEATKNICRGYQRPGALSDEAAPLSLSAQGSYRKVSILYQRSSGVARWKGSDLSCPSALKVESGGKQQAKLRFHKPAVASSDLDPRRSCGPGWGLDSTNSTVIAVGSN